MLQSPQRDHLMASLATKFKEFVDVFRNEPSPQLVTRLEIIYQELSELFTPNVAPSTSIPFSPPLTPCTQSSPPLPISSPSPQHSTPNSNVPFPQPGTAKLQYPQPTTPCNSGTRRCSYLCQYVVCTLDSEHTTT